MTNEELISIFKENKYSIVSVGRYLGLTKSATTRLFERRNINHKEIRRSWITDLKESYNKSPKLCKHCGKPIPWEKRNNDFCSKSCAVSENNKGHVKNPKGFGLIHKTKTNKESGKEPPQLHLCPICGEEACVNEFCKSHNIQQLNGLVLHLGFDSTAIKTKRVFDEFNRVREIVYNLYWNQGYSRQDLGKQFNYQYGTMPTNVISKTLGIPTRSLSEAVSNSIIQGKMTLPETNPQTGLAANIFHGTHTTWTGDEVFLRSSYELDYANYLDENQISYSVEDLRIEYYDSQKDKTRIAVPDFYLSDTNEIVEIKSDFTLDIQEMLDKFEAYKKLGYIPKLILEGEEVNLENLENLISEYRLDKIKNRNIASFIKQK